jgi:hypothetical protein
MAILTLKAGDYTIEAIQENVFDSIRVTVYDDYLQTVVPPSLYDVNSAYMVGETVASVLTESAGDFRRIFKAIEDLVIVDKQLGV